MISKGNVWVPEAYSVSEHSLGDGPWWFMSRELHQIGNMVLANDYRYYTHSCSPGPFVGSWWFMSRCFVIKPISSFKLGKSGLNLDQQSMPTIYPPYLDQRSRSLTPMPFSSFGIIWSHIPGFFPCLSPKSWTAQKLLMSITLQKWKPMDCGSKIQQKFFEHQIGKSNHEFRYYYPHRFSLWNIVLY